MPLYTHARQFPHLAGRSDADIRAVARRGILRRPGLVQVARLRNMAVVAGMVAAAALLGRGGGPGVGGAMQGVGFAMMLTGAGATAFALLWNLVWVNTVLYRITRDEVQRPDAKPALQRAQAACRLSPTSSLPSGPGR